MYTFFNIVTIDYIHAILKGVNIYAIVVDNVKQNTT